MTGGRGLSACDRFSCPSSSLLQGGGGDVEGHDHFSEFAFITPHQHLNGGGGGGGGDVTEKKKEK